MGLEQTARPGAAPRLDASIGNTPLVELSRFAPGGARLFAKLEWFNPGGSVKDRIAKAMLDDAESRGQLAPGSTIVEPTSGNTGVALAMFAAARGYKCIVVMPEGYGAVKARIMEAFGATVVRTPAEKLMSGSIERAKQIAAETPDSFIPNQFSNPVNPRAHFETTGPEIARALEGLPIHAMAFGVGTTGTFTGVARYLRQIHPAMLRVAVEPQGSILGGGERGPHAVEGIGLSFFPEILDRSTIDEVITVPDAEAFEACRELASTEGILAGGSSGAAAAAARKVARRLSQDSVVVTLLPDGAERYPDQGVFDVRR